MKYIIRSTDVRNTNSALFQDCKSFMDPLNGIKSGLSKKVSKEVTQKRSDMYLYMYINYINQLYIIINIHISIITIKIIFILILHLQNSLHCLPFSTGTRSTAKTFCQKTALLFWRLPSKISWPSWANCRVQELSQGTV